MTNPVDPETGAMLHRDVRPLTLTYKGESITFEAWLVWRRAGSGCF